MNNFNDSMLSLLRGCQGSPTLMLSKELENSPVALGAILIFDDISDFDTKLLSDSSEREGLVAKQLQKSLTFAISGGEQ